MEWSPLSFCFMLSFYFQTLKEKLRKTLNLQTGRKIAFSGKGLISVHVGTADFSRSAGFKQGQIHIINFYLWCDWEFLAI